MYFAARQDLSMVDRFPVVGRQNCPEMSPKVGGKKKREKEREKKKKKKNLLIFCKPSLKILLIFLKDFQPKSVEFDQKWLILHCVGKINLSTKFPKMQNLGLIDKTSN